MTSYIELLPVEIWELILSNISYSEDIYHISLTCKLFNNLIKRSITSINSKNILNTTILQNYPKIIKVKAIVKISTKEELDYISSRKFTHILLNMNNNINVKEYIFNNTQIKYIDIHYETVIPTTDYTFIFSLSNGSLCCSNIEYIDYENKNIKEIILREHPNYPLRFNKDLKYHVNDFTLIGGHFNKFLIGNWNINIRVTGILKHDNYIYKRYPDSNYNFYIACHDQPLDNFKITVIYIMYMFPNSNFDNIVYNRTDVIKCHHRVLIHTKNSLNYYRSKEHEKYHIKSYYDGEGYFHLIEQYNNIKDIIKTMNDNPMTEVVIDTIFHGEHINKTFKVI